jgi:hypothetical protein
MDPAFFVGKAVLLKWLNELLELNYTKVEQCCTGAAHCQILDIIWPGMYVAFFFLSITSVVIGIILHHYWLIDCL